jgi:hypothetical protein
VPPALPPQSLDDPRRRRASWLSSFIVARRGRALVALARSTAVVSLRELRPMPLRRPLLVLSALACLAIACAGPGEPPSHLHELDRNVPDDAPFDANRLISLEELTDSTVDAKLLRALLTYRAIQTQLRNPYGKDSFIATYFSNGRSAIDALVTAAQ